MCILCNRDIALLKIDHVNKCEIYYVYIILNYFFLVIGGWVGSKLEIGKHVL